MIKKFIISLAAAALWISLVFAGVDIPDKDQIANRDPGYCVWASLESICNFLGYTEGSGLVEWYINQPYTNGATPHEAEDQLRILKIPFISNYANDLEWIEKQLDKGRPVLIGFSPSSPLGSHACVAVDIKNDRVYFIDPNYPGRLFSYSKDDFIEYWSGWGIVVLPKPI